MTDDERQKLVAAREEIERLDKAWKEWRYIAERLQDDLRTGKRTCDFSFLGEDLINVDNTATFAQSNAEPHPDIRRILDRLRFCEDCLRSGVSDEYFGWAGDQPSLGELAQSDAPPRQKEIEAGMDRVLERRGFQTTSPDASAGLIEAAKRCTAEILRNCIWPVDSCTIEDEKMTAIIVDAMRACAAERGGK